ncbi:MAG TPA: carbohydrate porin [Thermodesulfobacteriota bacterium]|nr:carbohydrate porin [Thermodesulfobacteriota bacterium]
MPNFLLTILVLFSAFAALAPVRADEVLSSREYMTGDWGGARQRLEDWGLTVTAEYSADILGNPAGGFRKKVDYAGLLNLYLDFDLEKIFGIKRTNLIVSGFWASGWSLSARALDNYFTVAGDFNGNSAGLYQFFLQTSFWNEKLVIAVGRMGAGDDFAITDAMGVYVNDAFDPGPVSLAYNIPAFLSNPYAALGIRVDIRPVETFYIAGGVYNASPGTTKNPRFDGHIDFSFGDGAILIAEAGFTPGGEESGDAYKAGVYYDTGKFNDIAEDGKTETGNYGFYAFAEQMVYRESMDGGQGLTLWAGGTLAPDEEINTFPYFLSGGMLYEGLIPGRDNDVAAFGAAYGILSRDIEGQDFEIALEWTYAYQLYPWLALQPDVQWIINPGGTGEIPDALVAGVQVSLDL